MKKPNFKTTYLFYTVFLSLVVIILLLSVYRILAHFEKSQAKYLVGDYVEILQEAVDTKDADALTALPTDTAASRFSSAEVMTERFLTACTGKQLSYELSPLSFDVNNPLYNILCEDKTVAQLQLSLVSEQVKLGFLSIPEWELASFSPYVEALGTAYTLSVPADFTVKANGVLLTAEDVVSEESGICAYFAEGFADEPLFEVTDALGNQAETGAATLLSSADSDTKIYSVPVDYERFDVLLPADFTVTFLNDAVNVIVQDTDTTNYTYTIYSAIPVDLAFLSQVLAVSDSIGNPLTFREADGRLLPVYSEYKITAADCYRVYADDVLLNPDTAEQTPLTSEQYSDEEFSLATYKLTLAKDVDFRVLDEQDTPIDFVREGNQIEVPLFDCIVTLPANFGLRVNGKQLFDVPYTYLSNPGYQYIKQYMDPPFLCEYRIEGLAKAPTLNVTDNIGNTVNYLMTKGGELTITKLSGFDELPEELSAQVDPLDIAKKWSLFMTNDLEGSLNGYYNMRNYLVRDSYYDTVAYQWATNIDITFISDHIFRDPAFSKESVSNVVIFANNCFSCDIYFEKHMTLTRTGKAQDDIFHRQIFFVYIDDTDDNKDNPHWVIADMQEIQQNTKITEQINE